jgi:hypothetical protein
MIGTILVWILQIYATITFTVSRLIPSNVNSFINVIGTTPVKVLNSFGEIMPQIMHAIRTMVQVSFVLFFGMLIVNLAIKIITMFIPSNIIKTDE